MFKFPEKIDISKKGVNSEKKFLEKFWEIVPYINGSVFINKI